MVRPFCKVRPNGMSIGKNLYSGGFRIKFTMGSRLFAGRAFVRILC